MTDTLFIGASRGVGKSPVTIRFDNQLLARIRAFAKKKKIPLNSTVEYFCRVGLAKELSDG